MSLSTPPRRARASSASVRLLSPMVVGLLLGLPHCGGDDFGTAADDGEGGAAGAAVGAGGSAGVDAGASLGSGGAAAGSAGASGGSVASGGATTAAPSYEQEWFNCSADSDCKVVMIRACCACDIQAVNVAHEEDVLRVGTKTDDCPPCGPSPCPPMPDGAACDSGVCKEQVDCRAINSAINCGEFVQCRWMTGAPCGSDAGKIDVGCFPAVSGLCDVTPTCGQDPETGERYVFDRDCLPEGYSACGGADCAG